MTRDSIAQDDTPSDPREQAVTVNLDPPYVHLRPAALPPVEDAASVWRAKQAQRQERAQAIAEDVASAEMDLLGASALDSLHAQRLADYLTVYPTRADRHNAAAMALRVYHPDWERVSRYHAAERICGALRLWLSEHHVARIIPERAIRAFADRLAGLAHVERLNTFTGHRPTTPREWAAARLGLLDFSETE